METDSTIKLTKLAECAGCGAKVGAGELAKLLGDLKVNRDDNLLVGYDKSDDAAVYKINEDLAIVQTLDFFPPIVDDPYTFGAIAAANALSDIYAMGGEPKTALNIMAVPEDMPKDQIHEILQGGYAKVSEAGAVICGGHSIYDKEPKYGLSVTGFVHPERILTNSGARAGDELIYTKRIGIGVLTAGWKAEMLSADTKQDMQEQMMLLNKASRDVMVRFRVHACTDVTGFGVIGHLLEMAEGSGTSIEVEVNAVDFIPQAAELAKIGILPEGMYRNRHFAERKVDPGSVPVWIQDLLYDPQTSGGLMMAVDPADADALMEALENDPGVQSPQKIGKVLTADTESLIRLR